MDIKDINKEQLEKLSPEEKKLALKILEQYANKGSSDIFNNLVYSDYEEIPVDIDTFIDDENYLRYAWYDSEGKCKLFPFWREKLRLIFPNNIDTNFNDMIFSGARGLGKSEIAVLIAAYLMYKIMCLKNPLEYYHMKPTEKFCFAFMNITQKLAEDIANSKFQNTVKYSPWFIKHGTFSGRNNQYWNPPSYIEIIIGSQSSDVIGKPILFGFFDEINFIRNQDIEVQKKKAIDMIDTAIGGMLTRFVHNGKNPTILILGSSKRSEKSFLETHMKKKLEENSAKSLIVDEAVWKVHPKGTYSEKTFPVAVGNKFLVSQIVKKEEDIEIFKSKGYKILDVPIDFKSSFFEDIDRALCDFAGISSTELSKYISGVAVYNCVDTSFSNPFVKDIIEVGNGSEDKQEYKNFFDLSKVPQDMMSKPLFIHLDMSISGDMTGIAGVWISGKKNTSNENQGRDLTFQLAFSVSVKAPKGRQISFEKNRNFVRWLREVGFSIKKVTSDTFQSYDLQQQLKTEGFDCEILSVDRVDKDHVCKPYQYFKNAIYEQRFKMYKSQELIDELTDLERNINTGKVDHPVNGRKDVSDATCIEGSTEVFLTSGKHRTIKDLYDNGYDNEYILAYDIDKQSIVVEPIFKIINNGKKNTIKLTLDNGNELICTPDHKLLTRDGKYIEAKDSLDISLMPFNYEQKNMYRNRDYTYVYIPKNDLTNKGAYLHKLVAEQYHIKDKLSKEDSLQKNEWVVIHHKDVNRLNNNPDNLVYLTNVEHSKVHTSLNTTPLKRKQLSEFNKKTYARGEHPFAKMTQEQRRLNGSKSLTKWNKSERHRQLVSQKNQELLLEGQHPFQLYKEAAHSEKANKKRIATAIERYGGFGFNSSIIQQKCRASCLANNGYDNPWHSQEKQHEMQIIKLKNAFKKIVDKYKLEESNSMTYIDFKIYCYIEKFAVSSKEKDIKEAGLPIVSDNFEKDCKYFLKNIQIVGNFIRRFIKDTGKDKFTLSELIDYRDTNIENNKKFKDQFNVSAIRNLDTNTILRLGFNLYNHRVVKIEPVGVHDVYDIQLADIHNFALLCGIFAHNCGATFIASKYAEEYAYDYGEDYEKTILMNEDLIEDESNIKQQMVVDFEEELKKLNPLRDLEINKKNNNIDESDISYISNDTVIW